MTTEVAGNGTATQATENVPAEQASKAAPATIGPRGIQFATLNQLWSFAKMVAASGLAPKGMEKPEAIAVAIQYGMEVGLPAMASLQNIAVINGRPSLWGDALLALCQESGKFDFDIFEENFTGKPYADDFTAVCVVGRITRSGNVKRYERTFSVEDAKKAGLWVKDGTWQQYPKRMLQMRARSWALRDAFPDVLRGLGMVEEVMDIEPLSVEVHRRDNGSDASVKPQAALPEEKQPATLEQIVGKAKEAAPAKPGGSEGGPWGKYQEQATAKVERRAERVDTRKTEPKPEPEPPKAAEPEAEPEDSKAKADKPKPAATRTRKAPEPEPEPPKAAGDPADDDGTPPWDTGEGDSGGGDLFGVKKSIRDATDQEVVDALNEHIERAATETGQSVRDFVQSSMAVEIGGQLIVQGQNTASWWIAGDATRRKAMRVLAYEIADRDPDFRLAGENV